jgi:NADH:ubiquinone oxidoreductase subunit E
MAVIINTAVFTDLHAAGLFVMKITLDLKRNWLQPLSISYLAEFLGTPLINAYYYGTEYEKLGSYFQRKCMSKVHFQVILNSGC